MARPPRRRTPGNDQRRLAEMLVRLGRQYLVPTVIVLLVALAVGAFYYWHQQREAGDQATRQPAPPPTTLPNSASAPPIGDHTAAEALVSPHMLLGNPSGAASYPVDRGNYLVVKPHYALCYNDANGTANWVAWRVTAADLGDAPRKREFDPDAMLPAGVYRATHRSYSGSGFDRGHLCPRADRDATRAGAWSTFVMTNVIWQAPNVNQGAWAELEAYCRTLVTRHGLRLYVVAGPSGRGGRGSNGPAEAIDRGRVVVPASCWKVVVAVSEGGGFDDAGSITANARVIAVVMPNDDAAVGPDWAAYRTSVAEVERLTGYRFFTRLPPGVAEAVEGLTYPSEADAPFEPFRWEARDDDSTRQRVEALAGGRTVEEAPVERFFAELAHVEQAERFRYMERVLRESLSDVRVFRVGERRVDVYLVGRTHTGAWAGLHTVSVER